MVDTEIRRIGFTDLTLGRTSSLNIIFVHGLMGHPQKTWQFGAKEPSSSSSNVFKSIFKSTSKAALPSPSTSLFWPQDLLAQDLPDAKVWAYGYDADALQGIFTAKNQNSISQHGNDLKVKLERLFQGSAHGSIIFIAHSLGGVLVKDVLWQSDYCQKNTKGIVFLGTPHRGSELGGYAGIASNLAGMALQDINHKLVRSLEVDNQVLNIINREFIKTITKWRIPIHSFQEGKPISGVKGLHDKVVPDYSSVLNIDPSLETRETINHDHRQMAKCSRRSDEQYEAILGVAIQYASRTNVPITSSTPTAGNTNAPLGEVTSRRIVEPHYTIPYANRQFTGRRRQVEELEDRLLNQDEFQEFAICGLGGIGKTQIALAFCHFVKANHPEYSVFWVSALSRSSFEKDYAEIARKCAISLPDKKQMLQTVQQHLESGAAGPWIMIIDNVDTKELMLDPERGLKMYLPEHQKGIRIYTSRDEGLAHDIALAIDTMVVEEMEYQDAKALLQKYLGSGDVLHDEAAITELLEELEFLPLAIVQAASFMKKTYITVLQYLALMRKTDKNRVKLLSEENRQATRLGSSNPIIVTWLISFDRICEEEPSALKLLYFLAIIQNKDIPHSILPQESEVSLTRAVGILRNYSFLVKQDKGDIYDMHRLVHQAIRTWMQDSLVIDRLGEWQIAHLVDIWPSTDIKNELLWQKYLPHAVAAISASAEAPTESRASLSFLAGRCLRIDGRIQEAVDLLTDCYVWRTEQLDSNDEARMEAQRELAIAYRWSGHEAEAIQILSQLVEKEQSIPSLEDASHLQTLYELGMAQLWVGDSAAAVASLNRVVDNLNRTAQADNAQLLEALHGLVQAYRSDDQPEKALELLSQNPHIERKLDSEAIGDIQGDSLSHRTNTLGHYLEKSLDLIGKLDMISLKLRNQEYPPESRRALAKAILYGSNLHCVYPFSSVETAVSSIKRFWEISGKADSSIVDANRKKAFSDVNKVLGHDIAKTKEQQRLQEQYELISDDEDAANRNARVIYIINELNTVSTNLLAERYSIGKKDAQPQYLSVGPEIWAFDSSHDWTKPASEQFDLCLNVMKHCWISVMEIRQVLESQHLFSSSDMIYHRDITVMVGLECVLSRKTFNEDSSQSDRLWIRWKICIAVEYWQQGYQEAAIMHMEAAQRHAAHRKHKSLIPECQKWLQRFETEKSRRENA